MMGVGSKRGCAALLTAGAMLSPMAGHAQEPALTLPTVEVAGEAPRDSTRDEYFEKDSVSATKTDTPVLETPQSVTTITRQQLDDQNPQSVKDALNYTAASFCAASAVSAPRPGSSISSMV